ncbi:protein cornichon homolog 4 isoform X1 [Ursus americanus]|uniref:protein cornichon homolog 4 isoform X1 n=1 Tax=Ursus americanus TaxID=9643 RepID=UPI001E67B058|nr:protein cornichon homolog 4 isoform X1 [Ursus americanus]
MEAVVFVFSLLDCCALIFLSVYFIITLSDLECDYINARSCCSKLNKWVIPELIGHTIVTVLMLVSLHWFIFLLNLPVATWNIYRTGSSQQREALHPVAATAPALPRPSAATVSVLPPKTCSAQTRRRREFNSSWCRVGTWECLIRQRYTTGGS